MKFRSILLFIICLVVVTGTVWGQKLRTSYDKKVFNKAGTQFAGTSAVSDGKGVLVSWNVSKEQTVIGYDVYRYSKSGITKVGNGTMPGGFFRPGTPLRDSGSYKYFDLNGDLGSYYIVSGRDVNGNRFSSDPIFPRYVSGVRAESESQFEKLKESASSAKPIYESYSPATDKRSGNFGGFGYLPPNLSQQHWVAARPGVKIGVRETGFFRVSRTDLENAGFDVNTDESLWQLYLNGNQQAIVVGQNGDYIEFYGQGVDTRNTDTNIYFLVVGDDPGLRISSIVREPNGSTPATWYRENFYRRDRMFYISNLKNGDEENFFGQVISSTPTDIQFQIDAVDHSINKTYIQIGVNGFTAGQHVINVSVNGVPQGSFTYTGSVPAVADIGVPTQIINEGSNTVTMTASGPGQDFSLTVYVAAQYPRTYTARNDSLEFPVADSRQITVGGFTDSSIRVFDISAPDNPQLVSNATAASLAKLGSTFQVQIPSSSAAVMYAVTDSALKTVDSIVYNEPSTWSSVSNAAQMVIISYGDWMSEADTWATYRTNQGTSSVAIDIEDVYDEFGYGRKGPDAIREFVNFARLNWSTPPGYVLLIGDAVYDPRNYTGAGGTDFVPTDIIETNYGEAPSDEAIVDYDGDGLSEVSIGRIPAANATQITNVLTKVTTFESSLGTAPDRGLLCASDITQIIDFGALCLRVVDSLPASVPITSVNKADTDSRATLLAEIDAGKWFINYSGHGSVIAWTDGNFFSRGDVNNLTNQNDLTVFTMLTCLNGYFIDPAGLSLSEKLFLATNGGAAATWASTAETTPDIQEVLATRFYDKLGNDPTLDKMGDLVRDAKTAVQSSRDVRLSWHLMGDPAMKVK